MLRGRAVLKDLAREVEEAHQRYADAAEALHEVEVRHDALLDEEARVLGELARLYLPDLSPESVSAGLDALRHRLEEALAAQEERRRRLEGDAEGATERLAAARARLDELEEEEAALTERLDEARSRVEAVLEADEGHVERVEEHAATMALRRRLLKRRERLGAAASAERHRYENDRVFRYLHDRGYGGPAYEAGPVTYRLDRWLARRIDYETLSRNYRILKVGPRQLGAEIRRLGRRAGELEEVIDAREEEVGREEGLLPLLERRIELEARLGQARGELDRARSAREALDTELRAIEANRGRHFEEAVELHRDYLQGKTVRELETLARSTPDPRDDGLVHELETVRARLDEVRRELTLRREELQRASRRADRLSELRAAGLQRFADSRSFFPDGFDIGVVLETFLSGEAAPGDVIEELEGSRVEGPLVEEVPSPYFDAIYRELTAAFDAGLAGDSIVEADWEMEGQVETEVVVHDVDGRVIRRRVTRRSLGPRGASTDPA